MDIRPFTVNVPQPMLDVIGMPLVNVPAFELDWIWRTMIRLTGATSAKRWIWSSSNE